MIAQDNTLNITLPSDTEIVMSRAFDAPRELVFRAMWDPQLIPQWWGPRKYETIVDHMDFRVGGTYRFLNKSKSGEIFAFFGEYREIVPNEKVVETFGFEGMPGEPGLVTYAFTEHDGRCLVTERSIFNSKAQRDGILQSGMEEGARETYDRFAELLEKLNKKK
ncbi:MAG: SRPBCC family protein [Chloroflexota bacterium]|nr:SRPBCC family protein [Chloroflexota bacterium]